jgi:hypothetical protein
MKADSILYAVLPDQERWRTIDNTCSSSKKTGVEKSIKATINQQKLLLILKGKFRCRNQSYRSHSSITNAIFLILICYAQQTDNFGDMYSINNLFVVLVYFL